MQYCSHVIFILFIIFSINTFAVEKRKTTLDEKKAELIHEFLSLTRFNEFVIERNNNIVEYVSAAYKMGKEKAKKIINKSFNKFSHEVDSVCVQIVDENFTRKELRDINKFLKTEEGQKLLNFRLLEKEYGKIFEDKIKGVLTKVLERVINLIEEIEDAETINTIKYCTLENEEKYLTELKGLSFRKNSVELAEYAHLCIDKIVNSLNAYPKVKIKIVALVSSLEKSDTYDKKKLAQMRAEKIVAELIKRGIDKERLIPIGQTIEDYECVPAYFSVPVKNDIIKK